MSALRYFIERSDQNTVSGWGFDPEDPSTRLSVEVLGEACVLGRGEAMAMRADLARAGLGDGQCAFAIALQGGCGGQRVTVALRNPRTAKSAAVERTLEPPEGVVVFPADQAERLKAHGLTLSAVRGSMTFGPETWFEPPCVVHSALHGGAIQIGAFTGVFGGSLRNAQIGRYCSIAPSVIIGPNEHPTDWLTSSVLAENPLANDWDAFVRPGERQTFAARTRRFPSNLRRTSIGHDVWIGSNVLVRKGMTIGDGAIVAAGSVVTQDVPAYGVVAGVPARLKKMRFDERTVERLVALRWWRYAIHDFTDLPLEHMPAVLDALEERVASGVVTEWAPERATPAVLRRMLA